MEQDPARLSAVEERRDLLFRLLQKYGPSMVDVLQTAEGARRELETLDNADSDLAALAANRSEAEKVLAAAAAALTEKRSAAAGRLTKAVERLLPRLGPPAGTF